MDNGDECSWKMFMRNWKLTEFWMWINVQYPISHIQHLIHLLYWNQIHFPSNYAAHMLLWISLYIVLYHLHCYPPYLSFCFPTLPLSVYTQPCYVSPSLISPQNHKLTLTSTSTKNWNCFPPSLFSLLQKYCIPWMQLQHATCPSMNWFPVVSPPWAER